MFSSLKNSTSEIVSTSGLLLSVHAWLDVHFISSVLELTIKIVTLLTLLIGLTLTIRKHLKETQNVKISTNPSNNPVNDYARSLHHGRGNANTGS